MYICTRSAWAGAAGLEYNLGTRAGVKLQPESITELSEKPTGLQKKVGRFVGQFAIVDQGQKSRIYDLLKQRKDEEKSQS